MCKVFVDVPGEGWRRIEERERVLIYSVRGVVVSSLRHRFSSGVLMFRDLDLRGVVGRGIGLGWTLTGVSSGPRPVPHSPSLLTIRSDSSRPDPP